VETLPTGRATGTTVLTYTGVDEVEGGHLSLSAGLTQDGERVGSVQLEVDCGG
jgi:hypothetical protein